MGYESRLYVVDKSPWYDGDNKRYAEKIAVLNMAKCGDDFYNFVESWVETDCYIFADDGDTEITKDNYDKPLKEASIGDVVRWFVTKIECGENYRRFKVALSLLESFQTEQWKQDNIVVLHYGY